MKGLVMIDLSVVLMMFILMIFLVGGGFIGASSDLVEISADWEKGYLTKSDFWRLIAFILYLLSSIVISIVVPLVK